MVTELNNEPKKSCKTIASVLNVISWTELCNVVYNV